MKTNAAGDKGSGRINLESKSQEEEAAKKVKEETTRRVAKGARNLLVEEKQREEEEEAARKEKTKKEEAIQGKIAELEKDIAQEALNLGLEGQDLEDCTEEQSKKNEEDLGGEDQE